MEGKSRRNSNNIFMADSSRRHGTERSGKKLLYIIQPFTTIIRFFRSHRVIYDSGIDKPGHIRFQGAYIIFFFHIHGSISCRGFENRRFPNLKNI